ncbi:MAG: hypothetical protein J5509_09040 [Lachnospiraceae bacterium]|nr:hypothetical protein [Lachnospiraceae bacterium]
MKRKSPALALLWLLLIPGQLIISGLITTIGATLEASMYAERPDDVVGHPAPFITVMFALVGTFLVVIAVVVAIILTIVRMIVINKRNKLIDQMNTGYVAYGQQGQAPVPPYYAQDQTYYSPPEQR